jgi:hypothetical protein
MKRKTILLIILILLAVQTGYSENQPESSALPVVHVVEGVHKFETITEGVDVIHEFVIQNKGKAPLDITKVRPG